MLFLKGFPNGLLNKFCGADGLCAIYLFNVESILNWSFAELRW